MAFLRLRVFWGCLPSSLWDSNQASFEVPFKTSKRASKLWTKFNASATTIECHRIWWPIIINLFGTSKVSTNFFAILVNIFCLASTKNPLCWQVARSALTWNRSVCGPAGRKLLRRQFVVFTKKGKMPLKSVNRKANFLHKWRAYVISRISNWKESWIASRLIRTGSPLTSEPKLLDKLAGPAKNSRNLGQNVWNLLTPSY